MNSFENNPGFNQALEDPGGSLGVALALYYQELKNGRWYLKPIAMEGAYLGFEESEEEIESYLNSLDVKYHKFSDEVQLLDVVSDEIANGKVVGWHIGKMEFGPRALGIAPSWETHEMRICRVK